MQGWWRRYGESFWWTKACGEAQRWGMKEIFLWPLMILGAVKPAGRAGVAARIWRMAALTGRIGPYGVMVEDAAAVLLRSALMALSERPLRGVVQPVVRGPHWVGRALGPADDRPAY